MKNLFVCITAFFVLFLISSNFQHAQALQEVVRTDTVTTVFKTEEMVRIADNVVILFDSSSSMDEEYHDSGMTRLQVAKKMLHERVSRFPDVFPELNVGLYTYTPPASFVPNIKGYEVFYKMQPFNKAEFLSAVNSLPDKASGPTLLHNALRNLDKLLAKLSGRTVVFLFTDGDYNKSGAGKKPVAIAQALGQKYDVSFQIISTTDLEKNFKIMEAVASINASSRVYPMEVLLNHPESYTGAIFVIEESYIVEAETSEEVVGLKLDQIQFGSEGVGIPIKYKDDLMAAGKFLKSNPDSYIVLAGFTDNRGAEEYNRLLSKRRVTNVADYLTRAFKIDKRRVIRFWYGEAAPVADNNTAAGRQKNRRVICFISGLN